VTSGPARSWRPPIRSRGRLGGAPWEARARKLGSASKRWLSPTLFALTALCFLLPFATVSCDNAKTTFTGVQLVTRTVPRGGGLDEADCATDISTCVEKKGSGAAALALVSVLVGFALGVLGVEKGPGWCAGVALFSLLALGRHVFSFSADVTPHTGFGLALLFTTWATFLHMIRAALRKPSVKPARDSASPEADP
jgi:hypothetical protein